LNLTDYRFEYDSFMTLSLYMANLFESEDSNKLIESIMFDKVTLPPFVLTGRTTCTKFATQTRSFGFCYETTEILDQVIEAYEYFQKCREGTPTPNLLKLLLESCDIKKIDFSEKGPFGKEGMKYKQMVENYKAKKDLYKTPSEFKYNKKKFNPFYSIKKAPGV